MSRLSLSHLATVDTFWQINTELWVSLLLTSIQGGREAVKCGISTYIWLCLARHKDCLTCVRLLGWHSKAGADTCLASFLENVDHVVLLSLPDRKLRDSLETAGGWNDFVGQQTKCESWWEEEREHRWMNITQPKCPHRTDWYDQSKGLNNATD